MAKRFHKVGRCAKKHVTCELQDDDGVVISMGTNFCLNAQDKCPREPGEDYTKCKTICAQVGHAEEIALSLLPPTVPTNLFALITGIGWACRTCQEKLYAAGVISIAIK